MAYNRIASVNGDAGRRLVCTSIVGQPINELPGVFCRPLEVLSKLFVSIAVANDVNQQGRPSDEIRILWPLAAGIDFYATPESAYKRDKALSQLHSYGLVILRLDGHIEPVFGLFLPSKYVIEG